MQRGAGREACCRARRRIDERRKRGSDGRIGLRAGRRYRRIGQPRGPRHRLRGSRRHLLGLLGHVRPAHDQRFRRSRFLDHLRAPAAGRGHLPRGVRRAGAAQPAGRSARRALARAHRGVRLAGRASDPGELPVGYLLHERGHRHRAGAPRPHRHHGVRVPAHAAPAAHPRGRRPRARHRRHRPHRHEGQPRFVGHSCGRPVLGHHLGVRVGVLHAASRQGAGEVGQLHRDGPRHAHRRRGGHRRRAALDHPRRGFARACRGHVRHDHRGHVRRLPVLPPGHHRRRPCARGSRPRSSRRCGWARRWASSTSSVAP